MPTFNLIEGSLQDRFLKSNAKIQLLGGGFANGKTSVACIKALELSRDYPCSNGLIARSTYPKLNDTIRKEFLKWCPENWIKSFPKSANASNTCTMTNGTTINFRYIAQQGKASGEATTSNLLSATYDWIVIDQMEDPEIVHKDFLDLLGRLRGMARYEGNDPDMPLSGPRQMILTCNPNRGWVYKKLVKPIHDLHNHGRISPELLCDTDADGNMLLDAEGNPSPIIEIYEGSTYENKDNLEPDFIKGLEATYKGQMKDRFLLGLWAAYEGLVHPGFDEAVHVVDHAAMERYYRQLRMKTKDLIIIEGYDYGLAVPYCYLFGFVDDLGNVFIMDGAYQPEQSVGEHADTIKNIREEYNCEGSIMWSDPAIFRRGPGGSKVVGKTVADMLQDEGIRTQKGNNNINNGIIKVNQYLNIHSMHQNPMTKNHGAPFLYISDKLEFVADEFNGYYWRRDTTGDIEDQPIDKNDHAMNTIKYMLSRRPALSKILKIKRDEPVGWFKWGEREVRKDVRYARHG